MPSQVAAKTGARISSKALTKRRKAAKAAMPKPFDKGQPCRCSSACEFLFDGEYAGAECAYDGREQTEDELAPREVGRLRGGRGLQATECQRSNARAVDAMRSSQGAAHCLDRIVQAGYVDAVPIAFGWRPLP